VAFVLAGFDSQLAPQQIKPPSHICPHNFRVQTVLFVKV